MKTRLHWQIQALELLHQDISNTHYQPTKHLTKTFEHLEQATHQLKLHKQQDL